MTRGRALLLLCLTLGATACSEEARIESDEARFNREVDRHVDSLDRMWKLRDESVRVARRAARETQNAGGRPAGTSSALPAQDVSGWVVKRTKNELTDYVEVTVGRAGEAINTSRGPKIPWLNIQCLETGLTIHIMFDFVVYSDGDNQVPVRIRFDSGRVIRGNYDRGSAFNSAFVQDREDLPKKYIDAFLETKEFRVEVQDDFGQARVARFQLGGLAHQLPQLKCRT